MVVVDSTYEDAARSVDRSAWRRAAVTAGAGAVRSGPGEPSGTVQAARAASAAGRAVHGAGRCALVLVMRPPVRFP
ncbi:hypothetical protein GCM10010378_67290 [Streptomyces viridochromogenes]